jgi:metal-responsive CopG/Arc/MetJ family transcriptional regulator
MGRAKSTVKTARILISLPDEFLNEVDDVANSEHRSRSDLIREALRTYMRAMDTFTQSVGEEDDSPNA